MNSEKISGFNEQLSKRNTVSKEKREQSERSREVESLHSKNHLEDSSMYSIESDSIYYSLDDSYSSQDHLIPREQAKQASQDSGKQLGMMTRVWRNLLDSKFLNSVALNKAKEEFGGGRITQHSEERTKKTVNSVPSLGRTSLQLKSKRRRILSYIVEKIQKIGRRTKRKEPRTVGNCSLPKPKTIQKNEKQSTKIIRDSPSYLPHKLRSANEAAKTANNLFSKKEKAVVSKERG
ncbi:hypothetical protein PM729_02265 [Enterococcus mundtii]|nr:MULTISPECIES: hypothetical protein [Enterococcus]MDB7086510.1 hypothetical protein [Enterococcus mundtii]NBA62582.1 hypothetical protein [Enterococcus mundtii]